jgi:hypothetical protein
VSPVVDLIAGAVVGLVRGISDLTTREQVTEKIIAGLKASPPASVASDYAEAKKRALSDADEVL